MKLPDSFIAHVRAVENYLDQLEDVDPPNYCPELTESWFKVLGSRATLRLHFDEGSQSPKSEVPDTSAGEPSSSRSEI